MRRIHPPEIEDLRACPDVEASRTRQLWERQQRELQKSLEGSPGGWMFPRFLSGSVLGIGLAMVLDGVSLSALKLLGPVVVAAVVTPMMYFRARRQSRRPLEEVIQEAEAELEALTTPGWARRVVRRGVMMAAGIGLPVGALLAFGLPVEELPAGSRLLALAGFTLATAAWTLPAAFVLRWLSVRGYGRRS